MDWYDYIYDDGKTRAPDADNHPFAPGSIKLTVFDDGLTAGTVANATRDETMLFPQRMTVLEITDDPVEDPLEAYRGFIYDAETNTLSPPAPPSSVPERVTPRQARLALLNVGLLDTVEAKLRGKNRAAQIAWDYATEFNRNDPLITTIAKELNLTDAALDLLFKQAATL
jgi:hypothetical protein